MDRHQGACQPRVRQPGDQPGLHAGLLRVIEQPTQQLEHDDLEQPIGQQALAAAHAVGLGEQEIKGPTQTRHARQWQGDQAGQGPSQRVALTAIEDHARAGEVGAIGGWVVKAVGDGAWIEQQRRLVELHPPRQVTGAGMTELEATAPQHMQEAVSVAGVEMLAAAQHAVVVQLRLDAEVLEDAGEAIDGAHGVAGWGRG